MRNEQANELRFAIENLITAKLCDALNRRDGFARLLAHRSSGVASADIRSAEQALEAALERCVIKAGQDPSSKQAKGDAAGRNSPAHAGSAN